MSRIEKTIEVNAPVSECYAVWTDFEHFPMFMKNVKEVRYKGDQQALHWVVKGPMGKDLEWDAEVDSMQPNKAVSWHSKTPSDVQNAGAVRFEELANARTSVTVTMEYDAPAGALGDMVAAIFQNPDTMVKEDLENFKELVEGESRNYNNVTEAGGLKNNPNLKPGGDVSRTRMNEGSDDFHTSGATHETVLPPTTTGEPLSPDYQSPRGDDEPGPGRPAAPGPII